MKRLLFPLFIIFFAGGALFAGMKVNLMIQKSACKESGGRWDKSCNCCEHSEDPKDR